MLNSTTSRLAAFAVALCAIAGAAAAVGASTHVAPPFQDCLKVAAADAGVAGDGMAGGDMVASVPGADGLHAALAGLRLVPEARTLSPSGFTTWRFRIERCDGAAQKQFDREHGKLLHLIVVRSDLSSYQHLHPRLGRDGTFSVRIAAPRPGAYRAIADFVVDSRKYVLGTTLLAPGDAADQPLPRPSLYATSHGYDVELQRPAELRAGDEAQLTFRITRHGRPAGDLQPYLGAYGHLVALHAPDLAYSHVHPNGEDRSDGAITFDTELHARGTYRLFLQFKTGGRVHTAAFTQTVS
jgi:hypothetical protein